MPQAGTQGTSKRNCMPAAGANVHHIGTEMANSMSATTSAAYLATRVGRPRTRRAPTTGHARRTVKTSWEYTLVKGRAEHEHDADHEDDDVDAEFARLKPAAEPAEGLQIGRAHV